MNSINQQICIDETTKFYSKNADSFSETRTSAWSGWNKLLPYINALKSPISIQDIACGNLRFEKFLIDNCIQTSEIQCLDNCTFLVPNLMTSNINFIKKDIYELIKTIPKDRFNLNASFGFMHHIPDAKLRIKFLEYLINSTTNDGIVALSCWNFIASEKLKNKAIKTTKIAERSLKVKFEDKNDYFLNWQDDYTTFRYCHNFTQDECTNLATQVSGRAELIDIYRADGKDNNLNIYMIFRKSS